MTQCGRKFLIKECLVIANCRTQLQNTSLHFCSLERQKVLLQLIKQFLPLLVVCNCTLFEKHPFGEIP